MGKLHELLAVEGDLKSRAQQAKKSVSKLFTTGAAQLMGKVITYQLNEGEDERVPEITEMATTVSDELKLFQKEFGKWIDVSVQKEITNREASADVIIDGEVILKNLPATALLNLESKLSELRAIYEAIPINTATEKWNWDDGREHYISADRVTYITKKVPQVLVLYDATEEHPAQTQSYHEDVRVGTRTTTLYSGMLSPKDKREKLAKVDQLIQAVKKARQRANDIVVKEEKIAKKLFNFIEGLE